MEALNEEANSMIDTFQIYLQTLISQALDSNFVKEIVKEQGIKWIVLFLSGFVKKFIPSLDEYFLSSIAAVEDHWILPKRNMLKEIIKMKKPFQVCGYFFLRPYLRDNLFIYLFFFYSRNY